MTDTPEDDNVVKLFEEDPWVPITPIDMDQAVLCPPDDVLSCQMGELQHVVLIGVRKETGGIVLASSISRMSDIKYLTDVVKTKITNLELE